MTLDPRTNAAAFALVALAGTAQADVIASDDFDAPVNLISYSAIDAEGNDPQIVGQWQSDKDHFGIRSMDFRLDDHPSGYFLTETIVDNSLNDIFDTNGILTPDYTGNFFAICDTDNGDNPSGVVTGTWVFDICGSDGLTQFSVDMAATGNWYDDGENFERFTWSYQIDNGPVVDLLTVRADQSVGVVTYNLASGGTFRSDDFPDPQFASLEGWGVTVNGNVLLNQMTTLTAPMSGVGERLTITLEGYVNDNNAALVADNLVIEGIAGTGECVNCDGVDVNDDGSNDIFDILWLADKLDDCAGR